MLTLLHIVEITPEIIYTRLASLNPAGPDGCHYLKACELSSPPAVHFIKFVKSLNSSILHTQWNLKKLVSLLHLRKVTDVLFAIIIEKLVLSLQLLKSIIKLLRSDSRSPQQLQPMSTWIYHFYYQLLTALNSWAEGHSINAIYLHAKVFDSVSHVSQLTKLGVTGMF